MGSGGTKNSISDLKKYNIDTGGLELIPPPPLTGVIRANSPGVFLRSWANSPQNLTPPEFFQKKLTPSEKNSRAFGAREKFGPFVVVLQGKFN